MPRSILEKLRISTGLLSCVTVLPSLRLMILMEYLIMVPLGVTGGSQEMTRVLLSVDSASKLVTALDSVDR